VGIEALEESTSNAESTSAGDGLGDGNILEDRAVGTVGQDGCGLGESRDAGDSSVLLVKSLLDDALLGSANGRQNVWFAVVVTVGTDTCKLLSHPH